MYTSTCTYLFIQICPQPRVYANVCTDIRTCTCVYKNLHGCTCMYTTARIRTCVNTHARIPVPLDLHPCTRASIPELLQFSTSTTHVCSFLEPSWKPLGAPLAPCRLIPASIRGIRNRCPSKSRFQPLFGGFPKTFKTKKRSNAQGKCILGSYCSL